ncbi:MAG: AraC family transcriptional regulator [Alphaproteobacteria bacterium]|nr:AraC family transcriptional regulator [Alphaproteobacteria bacterium]MCB9696225.1 AraC family transcriptional regulator [Alphaproteobacteria bacterium]
MSTVRLESAWRLVPADLGLSIEELLRRAELPADLLSRPEPRVGEEGWFRLWEALVETSGDPDIGLRIGQAVPAEAFDPPLFAALCSPDLATAAARLSTYKRLMGPLTLKVGHDETGLGLVLGSPRGPLPVALATTELVFLVSFARMATRTELRPTSVEMALPAGRPLDRWAAFFGATPRITDRWALTFSTRDAVRPFLTANAGMWQAFEPQLRRRLAEIDAEAAAADRVRAVLVELLPSGRASIDDVGRALGLGARTLQRRLGDEGTSYQRVLDDTRERLARHYLSTTAMAGPEIGFLLGYDDPNSFVRAFHRWTGSSPEKVRAGYPRA